MGTITKKNKKLIVQEENTTNKWQKLATEAMLEKTIAALTKNGFTIFVTETSREAKSKALEVLPAQAEVMTMSSVTVDTIGLAKEINESGQFQSVRNKLNSMNRETQGPQMKKEGAAPDWSVGSVHAVTQDGSVLIASATGSQLPAYAYGSNQVLWIVGTQKIVKNTDEGIKRIYEYTLPLEDARARKAYGMGSGVNKILIINREVQPGRINLIFVKENLGF